ncbi:MAG TPA: DUF3090 family protein [Ktedonobacterales bacterium]
MSEDLVDFGRAQLLGAEAIGEPGNRRFRIYARSPQGSASLWLEREQLDALGQAMEQLIARITSGLALQIEAVAKLPKPPGAPADFPEEPDVEFLVGNMQIGYDESVERTTLRAGPLILIDREGEYYAQDDGELPFSISFSRAQTEQLAQHIRSIMASGRPRCPFCGRPMEPNHMCDKQNGFHPAALN